MPTIPDYGPLTRALSTADQFAAWQDGKQVAATGADVQAFTAAASQQAADAAEAALEEIRSLTAVLDDITNYDGSFVGKYPATRGGIDFVPDSSALILPAERRRRIGRIAVGISSVGDGRAALTIAEGTLPNLTFVRAIQLPNATATGPKIYATDASGTPLNNLIEETQHVLFSAPAGGVGISTDLADATCHFTYPGVLSSGTAALTPSVGQRFAAAVEVLEPRAEIRSSVLSAELNDRIDNAGAGGLPDAPTEWQIEFSCGQSNEAGYNEDQNPLVLPAGWVKQYHNGALSEVLGDPIGDPKPGYTTGSSMLPATALEIIKARKVGVIIVPAAAPGSSLLASSDAGQGFGDWSATGPNKYTAAIAKLNAAKAAATAAGLSWFMGAVHWCQGEGDAEAITAGRSTIEAYTAALPDLVDRFVADCDGGEDLPFIITITGRPAASDPASYAAVRAAQRAFIKSRSNVHLGFGGAVKFFASMKDYIHWSTAQYNLAGTARGRVSAIVTAGRA